MFVIIGVSLVTGYWLNPDSENPPILSCIYPLFTRISLVKCVYTHLYKIWERFRVFFRTILMYCLKYSKTWENSVKMRLQKQCCTGRLWDLEYNSVRNQHELRVQNHPELGTAVYILGNKAYYPRECMLTAKTNTCVIQIVHIPSTVSYCRLL